MNKSVVSTVSGIAATALVAGTAAYVMNAKSMKGQRRAIKKTAAKAGRLMGGVMNHVADSVADHILG